MNEIQKMVQKLRQDACVKISPLFDLKKKSDFVII